MKEFELIEHIRKVFSRQQGAEKLVLPIGDDCSVIRPPRGMEQVTTVDSLVDGNHFTQKYFTPKEIGKKAVRVNLSDMASMGAEGPYYAWFVFAIPKKLKDDVILGIIEGIKSDCRRYGIITAGGNITSAGELSLHVTMTGWVKPANKLTRSGARIGDAIFVTGKIGEPTLAYKTYKRGAKPASFLMKSWTNPKPRPEIGIFLASRKIASACIDISDGIFQDMAHITKQSGVGAVFEWEKIPMSRQLKRLRPTPQMIGFGEDYELLFTVPKNKLKLLLPIKKSVTQIGQIVGSGIKIVDKNGSPIDVVDVGWHQPI